MNTDFQKYLIRSKSSNIRLLNIRKICHMSFDQRIGRQMRGNIYLVVLFYYMYYKKTLFTGFYLGVTLSNSW